MHSNQPPGPMVPLKVFRQLRGWTQEDVARRIRDHATTDDGSDGLARTSHATISNVESGNKPASGRLLIAWALVLGLNPVDIWPGNLREPVAPGVPVKRAS